VTPLLNVDLGELPDEPDELYALADLANVACGGHAGGVATMTRALERCAHHGTAAGAHPSYPDREHFGRRRLDLPVAEVARAVGEQCAALAALAARAGLPVTAMKPHGALYHAADADAALAEAVVAAARAALGDVAVVGPAGGALADAARRAGLAYLREGFADRGRARGVDGRWTLVPRGQPGALLGNPAAAAAQARALVDEGAVDTLCVHGDGDGALAVARAVRAALGPRAARRS
jgi:UPF0271 protein